MECDQIFLKHAPVYFETYRSEVETYRITVTSSFGHLDISQTEAIMLPDSPISVNRYLDHDSS